MDSYCLQRLRAVCAATQLQATCTYSLLSYGVLYVVQHATARPHDVTMLVDILWLVGLGSPILWGPCPRFNRTC